MTVGSDRTKLIVLRGNSGSGKSTVSHALRDAYGRGLAWVSQDLIRRIILKEKAVPGGANIGLIDQVARYCLDHGQQVVLDGILDTDRYGPMLAGLDRDHLGSSHFYYFDVSLNETLHRHATRPQATEFGPLALAIGLRHPDIYGAIFCASPGGGYKPPGVMPSPLPRAYLVAGTLEPFFQENATRWATALRDAGAEVVMTERLGSHGDAFWREELPLMVAWAFER
jgi:predicted kinase